MEPQLDKTKAISALINVMNDPLKQVRISAISALGELKSVEAKDSLIKALHIKDEEIKLFAAQSLGMLGKQAESAGSDLLPLLNNNNFRIRQVTAIALRGCIHGVLGSEQRRQNSPNPQTSSARIYETINNNHLHPSPADSDYWAWLNKMKPGLDELLANVQHGNQ